MKLFRFAVGACAAAFVAAAVPVLAQIAPSDSGAGVRLGLQDMHATGQVGSVTVYRASSGSGSIVVINVQGMPEGKVESASIQRGKSCAPPNFEQNRVYALNDVRNGRSTTVVNVPESRLLSGNYVVIVHSGELQPMNGNAMHGGMMNGGMMNGGMMSGAMASKGDMARWTPALCGHLYHGT